MAAELRFYYGVMGSGKSVLALQQHHQMQSRGKRGLLLTCLDRGGAMIRSRVGIEAPATDVTGIADLAQFVLSHGELDYVICDEVSLFTVEQADQLADLVDDHGIDVYAYGLIVDFRSRLFPATARLLELADRREALQVQPLCWCGRPASQNARIVDGEMVTDGALVVVGDITGEDTTRYELLCRPHYRRGELGPA